MYSVQDQISDLSNMYPHNKFEITDGFPFWKYHLKAILQCFRNMSILKNDIYTRFLFLFPWKLSAEIWTQKEARQNRSLISPRFLGMTKYDWISVSIQQSFSYTFNFKNRLEFFFSNCQTVLVSGRLVLQHYFRLPLWITSFPKTRNSRISWGTSMPLCSQTLLYWDKKWSRIFKF